MSLGRKEIESEFHLHMLLEFDYREKTKYSSVVNHGVNFIVNTIPLELMVYIWRA